MSNFIPFGLPDIGEDEIQEVVDTLRSRWLTTGRKTAQFEREFAHYTGAKYVLAVNSGTAALHLALLAMGIGPGDEVITTPMTFCATVNTILHVGAKPVLVDIGDDLNIDAELIEASLGPRTRAIVPVHIAGLPCDMKAIGDIARRHCLRVLEDAAHAVGSCIGTTRIGAGTADAVAFSFYANKNISMGEGGAVTTDDPQLDEKMRRLCLHGISRDAWSRYTKEGSWYYEVVECGEKYNLSDVLSSIGLHQLRRIESMTARRTEIAAQYTAALKDLPEIELPKSREGVCHCWHLYVIRLNLDYLSIDRAQFISEMKDRDIGCSVHFIPIPLHPYYKTVLDDIGNLERTMREYPRLVSLPLYPSMTDNEVARVIDAVRDTVRKFRIVKTAGASCRQADLGAFNLTNGAQL